MNYEVSITLFLDEPKGFFEEVKESILLLNSNLLDDAKVLSDDDACSDDECFMFFFFCSRPVDI